MKRTESQIAKEEKRVVKNLHDMDFLLGVNDESRMGALRFKLQEKEPFLNNDQARPTPPWSSVRELQHGISLIESDKDNKEVRKWLSILLAPGSSLGGARPKANIIDEKGNLWIAKFPSKEDTIDKAAWEFLAYKLATKAGIEMAECKIEKISGKYFTFFTKRFDRLKHKRVHFASAMTMTGNNEDTIKDNHPSYLDIAEFIQFNESNNTKELHQLWRRMVFNIAISNTDDHLRNHGFILTKNGWQLSPAYDINPSIDKDGLSLNIDSDNNTLDFNLAKSVGEYFQLKEKQMDDILKEIKGVIKNWKTEATKIGISKAEIGLMSSAYKF
jgi:serine/threonine-protein kinase HipA